MKRFLDRFSKKVLTFIQTNDSEVSKLQNKVARDIANSEKQTQESLKALNVKVEQFGTDYDSKIQGSTNMLKANIQDVSIQLSKMETKEVLCEIIQNTRDKLEQKLIGVILTEKDDTLMQVDAKFLDLNTCETEFGPEHETLKSLKDYSVAKMKELTEKMEGVETAARKELEKHKWDYKRTKELTEGNDRGLRELTSLLRQSDQKLEEL